MEWLYSELKKFAPEDRLDALRRAKEGSFDFVEQRTQCDLEKTFGLSWPAAQLGL
jgi:hypothetical protein